MRDIIELIIVSGLSPLASKSAAIEVVTRLYFSGGYTPKYREQFVSGITLTYDFGSIVIDCDGNVTWIKLPFDYTTVETAVRMVLAALAAKGTNE